MKRISRLAYIFLWWLLINCVSAQQRDIKFRHIDAHNGLPASSVTAVVKDSSGYIWIGTRNGLCRYDGSGYTVYQHDYQRENSLPDNNVISLLVTRDNQVWISTSQGACFYNRVNGQFEQLALPAWVQRKRMGDSRIFLQDKKGYIWFEDYSDVCLVGYNPVTKRFKKIDFFAKDGGREVAALYEDAKGNFWISRHHSVYYYQPETGNYKKISNQRRPGDFQPSIVTGITESVDGSIWFTSWGGGVERYEPSTDRSAAYLVEPTTQFNGTKNVLNSPGWIKDSYTGKSNLWMMSEYGVLCFDTLARKFQVYRPDIYNLYANKITFGVSRFPGSFFDPAQNILWCWGPMGIDICDFNSQPIESFQTLTEIKNIQTGSMDGFINNIANHDEYFISCFAKNTLMVYNEAQSSFEIKTTPVTNGIPVLFQATADNIWLSSGPDVWQWNRKNNSFSRINQQLGLPDKPAPGSRINCYFKDSRNTIWIGSNKNGVARYDPIHGSVFWLNQMPTDKKAAPPVNINQLIETKKGTLYALDSRRGLFEIANGGTKTQRFLLPDTLFGTNRKTSLPIEYFGIAANNIDGLWLNTNKGLAHFDTRTNQYALADKSHLLPPGIPDNIVMDTFGYLWLSYTDQLAVFDPANNRVRLFNYRNGYQGSPDGSTFLINAKGELRIGYNNHIELIHGDPFERSVYSLPGIVMTYVTGNRYDSVADVHDAAQKIPVSYKSNNLEIAYALPLYHYPEEITYSYRLKGYESAWNNEGTSHTAKYTNLPGGSYVFEVKAFDPDSGLYSAVASVAVVVNPPFWKTGWFIALMVLMLVTAVYLAYRYRINQLLKLERMRVAISSDLHDEVGSTLSSISIYSNVARQMAGINHEESNKYLERIETSSREMIDSMSDIVWSINPANDDPAKLLERMRAHAYEILGAAGVNLHWNEAPALNIKKMKMDRRKNVYLVFKEGINNAAKYARATDIFVDIKTLGGHLVMTIRDNGVGFNTDAGNHTGNGLKNMELRSRLLKGQLKIVSSPGKGTRIYLACLVQ